jgi:hypothetical protein
MSRPKHSDTGVEKHFSVLEHAHWTVVFSEKDQAYYLTCQLGDTKDPCLKVPVPSAAGTARAIQNFIGVLHPKRHPGAYPPG